MEMNEMQQVAGAINNGTQAMTGTAQGLSTAAGTAIGAAVAGPAGAIAGGALGGAVGGVVQSALPSHTLLRGTQNCINFVKFNKKPYWLEIITPTTDSMIALDKHFKYYGCPTKSTETLSFGKYYYEGHAFVQGHLHYNDTIPLDKFKHLVDIFERGVHVLEK